ncbi:gustatory receptor for sugar taste 43a-like [Anticarsia gemmatalis]|uniref:gustatory receptor for sugar taste 43a-like n=1 Tax=Anticarsia gemmatalis TaxID=129554 RepID=UPI003F75AF0A
MDLEEPLQKECTVSGTLSFVLRMSRLVGIAPLKFEKVRDGWRIRVSRFYSVYGFIVVIVFVLFAIVALMSDLAIDTEKAFRTTTNSNRMVWILDILVVGVVVIAGAYTGMNRMKYMIDCIAQLKDINKELSHFSHQTISESDRKKWIMVVFTLVFGCFTVFTDYGLFMFEVVGVDGNLLTSSFYIFFGISSIKLLLLVIQFALIAMWVLPTLQLLNNCLRDVLRDVYKNSSESTLITTYPKSIVVKENSKNNVFNRFGNKSVNRVIDLMAINGGLKTTPSTIHQMSHLYCSLCDIIRQLDDSTGFILVLLLFSFLVHLIITPYHLVTGLFHDEQSDHSSVPLQLAWAVVHFSKLMMIVEPCHRTHAQMDQTRNLINQMLRYTSPEDFAIISELKLFYRHLMLNQVTYSPMQLFTLNRTLIAAIMGSITTYLVVVIQL